ncbi:MAG: small subunit ribosomal protein [Patescibacteria group bacterium]|nr:small subunit ribosomal protein [Patescibacteria group bacterium]
MTEKSHSAQAELSQASESKSPAKAKGESTTPVFEVGFHLVPTISEDGVVAVVEKIHGLLNDAEVISEQFPVRMTLAYQVERSVQGKREKYTESYFGFIKFATERDAIPAFQAALRAMPEVLRYLVINTEREDVSNPRRAVFASTRLEGEVIHKPQTEVQVKAEVSEEELDKSIDALVN